MATTFKINVLNPKAIQILKNLAELNLITIEDPDKSLAKILQKLRSGADDAPSLEEITAEVDKERSKRYEK